MEARNITKERNNTAGAKATEITANINSSAAIVLRPFSTAAQVKGGFGFLDLLVGWFLVHQLS